MSRGDSAWWWYKAANIWRKQAQKRRQRKAVSHYRKLGFTKMDLLKRDIGTDVSAWVTSRIRSKAVRNGPEHRLMIEARNKKTRELYIKVFGREPETTTDDVFRSEG